MRVLLIESEGPAGQAMQQALRSAGGVVDWVTDAGAGQDAAAGGVHAVVLLDLDLQGPVGGMALLVALRARGATVPVLASSARSAVADRIQGLDAGADDYLVKPVDVGEVLARVRALARRHGGGAARSTTVGALQVDAVGRRVTREGEELALTAKEFALLDALLRKPGAVVSRRRLEESIYGWGEEVGSNVVDVHLHNLRRKVGRTLIRTVRGVGYKVVG